MAFFNFGRVVGDNQIQQTPVPTSLPVAHSGTPVGQHAAGPQGAVPTGPQGFHPAGPQGQALYAQRQAEIAAIQQANQQRALANALRGPSGGGGRFRFGFGGFGGE